MKNKRIATFRDFVGELKVNYRRTEMPSVKVTSSISAVDFMRQFFDECMDDHEEVKVLHLSRSNGIVNVHHVTTGSSTGAIVPIKEILKHALLINTHGLILFHNHPSGALKASTADIEISKKLKKACSYMELSLLDSIIITRESYYSLADGGLL